jgi:hypothetical protein
VWNNSPFPLKMKWPVPYIQSNRIIPWSKRAMILFLGNQLSELSVINHVKCNSQLLLYEHGDASCIFGVHCIYTWTCSVPGGCSYWFNKNFNFPIMCLSCLARRVWKYHREVIRILKSKKNRQHSGQKKKYKKTNNDLQNIHIKLKIDY